MDPASSPNVEERAETLIAELVRLAGSGCACGRALCGHALLFSFVLGFKREPQCLGCLDREFPAKRDPEGFRRELLAYVHDRACYREAWAWTGVREGACQIAREVGTEAYDATVRPGNTGAVAWDAEWNAGDLGCGDLVLELRTRLAAMKPGQVLKVTANDPGAPEDLPAWCGLTGHALAGKAPPAYWIRRRADKEG